ncbi:methyl-accepting chemotaxis protein [Pseudobutyrivibrio xylanivorans]|uniref:Methyl-accepting chemotaxis protein n=1 Tax=Pseudobutyrivibrio xylanivorans DSM 14809 TaxID=1123012 RepID=A0A1M6AK53_PSEXY|nr:methyl-accepting chemotaxis protein [Pseudobutyrivibrio xylanivorans]SHI36860.1 methyl-accepting chemotaxis protein [Pseudobutyrivibrio xylanivorans DSM 14809]
MAKKPKPKSANTQSGINPKDSVKTKLIVIMALLVAVPLIVAIFISYLSSSNKAKKDALELLETTSEYVEKEYEQIIRENVDSLQMFATSPSTMDYMEYYGTDGSNIPDAVIQAHMAQINTIINDGNDSVVLTLASGQQILRTDGGDCVNIADREFFQRATSTGKPAVSGVIVSKSSGARVAIIAVPIFSESGEVIGECQRSIDLSVLHEFLAANISDGYIVDQNGIMAAHAQFDIGPDEEYDMSGIESVTSSESSGMFEQAFSGANTYNAWVKEPITGYSVIVAEQESAITAEANKAAITVVIIGIILLVVAVIISLFMATSFTNPILAVTNTITELADGRFKKINGYTGRKDEFGEIVRSTNSVIDKLDNIVTAIKQSATTVTTSSEDLADMANQIAATTDTVANAVQEIATGAVQQAEEIQQAAENVGKITDAVTGVQSSTENMESLAGKMKDASQTSSKSLLNLQDSSSDMTAKIEEIARTISATKDAVTSINESVEGISGIASQTNLLSLNASIEAARAGEAGKGFAVVAEEIRKLADDSDSMAQDIRTQMDILLKQSEAAVAAANLVKQGNLEQQEAIGGTLESVNGMLDDINGTVDGVKEIAGGAETCVSSNDIVSDAMSSLSAISEENAASSETTGASVQELSATVSSLANSADDLKEIAVKLNEEISFFKDDTE